MSRAAISVDRVEFNPADNSLTVYEKKDRSSSNEYKTYTIMEFMALLAAHIPSPYESLVYYYGLYSSSHRGKERRENKEDQSIGIQETKGTGKASSTWARLIHRIFEVNPLQCIKCGGQYAGCCVYYRLPDIKEYTQTYWGGDHKTSSLKSENPNNQYPGYGLLGLHTLNE